MKLRCLAFLFTLSWLMAAASAANADAEIKNPSISGGAADGKVRLVIEGLLNGQPGDREKLIFSTALQQSISVARDKITTQLALTFDILQGEPKELALTISGEG